MKLKIRGTFLRLLITFLRKKSFFTSFPFETEGLLNYTQDTSTGRQIHKHKHIHKYMLTSTVTAQSQDVEFPLPV